MSDKITKNADINESISMSQITISFLSKQIFLFALKKEMIHNTVWNIIKNKECVGYTAFRNVLVEQRIKLLKLHTLLKEITNLEKNDATGKVDHPKQTVKILEDGTKVKSVGKDISDSLGGAIYNAILSVDVNELDYLENITIAETGIATLNSYETVADRLFGFNRDARGNLIQIDNKTDENEDELISNAINQEIKNNQKVLDQIKQSNKNTKLSDQQLLDMYNTMTGNGFVIF